MPLVAEEFNLSYTDLAWISSILFIGYAIMLIPAGFLADRYNPAIVLLLGSFISSISNILIALATGGFLLKMLMFMNGLGQGMGWAPLVKLLSVKVDRARIGLAIGFLMSSAMIGPSIAYTTASLIAYFAGWKLSLIIPALTLSTYSIMFRRIGISKKITEFNFNFLKNPNIWFVGISYFFFYAIYRGFLVWMPTFLYEKTNLYLFSSLFSSILSAIGALLGYLGYYISIRLYNGRMKRVIAYSMLTAIPLCFIMKFSEGMYQLVWLFLFYTLLSLPLWLYFIYPPKIFPLGVVGTITGFIDSLGYLGNFTGTLILGITYSTANGEPFYIMAVFLLLGGLFSLLIKEND